MLNFSVRLSKVSDSASTRPQWRWSEVGLWLLLLAVLLINLPAFLCLALDADAVQWDLGAHTVLQGGVPYRDWLENNLPGMLWLHILIRALLGWRSEALRLVDILVVLTLIGQLTRWLPAGAATSRRLVLAGVLLIFYLSTSEWCHCQRDVWMLVPAVAALSLRLRQVPRLGFAAARPSRIAGAAFAEGILWGVAFWIKPFVLVPAFLCWLLSARLAWQFSTAGRRIALEGVAVISGGLTCGAVGTSWLAATGAWPAFTEIMFVWNREYVVADQTHGSRWLCVAGLLVRFFPWVLVHLISVPQALEQIRKRATGPDGSLESPAQPLLAMFYLGWLVQASFLQHSYDYVQVPPLLLALTVVGCRYADSSQPSSQRLLLALLVICVLARFPAICVDRLLVWDRCLQEGSTAALRDRLTLLPKVSWSDLEEVKVFLRRKGIRDGELSCMHMATISVYKDLDVKASTRFPFLLNMVLSFGRQREVIFGELAASRQRFLICDAEGYGMDRMRLALLGEEGQRYLADTPAPAANAWSHRIAFRSGRYIVFRFSGVETSRWFVETLTP